MAESEPPVPSYSFTTLFDNGDSESSESSSDSSSSSTGHQNARMEPTSAKARVEEMINEELAALDDVQMDLMIESSAEPYVADIEIHRELSHQEFEKNDLIPAQPSSMSLKTVGNKKSCQDLISALIQKIDNRSAQLGLFEKGREISKVDKSSCNQCPTASTSLSSKYSKYDIIDFGSITDSDSESYSPGISPHPEINKEVELVDECIAEDDSVVLPEVASLAQLDSKNQEDRLPIRNSGEEATEENIAEEEFLPKKALKKKKIVEEENDVVELEQGNEEEESLKETAAPNVSSLVEFDAKETSKSEEEDIEMENFEQEATVPDAGDGYQEVFQESASSRNTTQLDQDIMSETVDHAKQFIDDEASESEDESLNGADRGRKIRKLKKGPSSEESEIVADLSDLEKLIDSDFEEDQAGDIDLNLHRKLMEEEDMQIIQRIKERYIDTSSAAVPAEPVIEKPPNELEALFEKLKDHYLAPNVASDSEDSSDDEDVEMKLRIEARAQRVKSLAQSKKSAPTFIARPDTENEEGLSKKVQFLHSFGRKGDPEVLKHKKLSYSQKTSIMTSGSILRKSASERSRLLLNAEKISSNGGRASSSGTCWVYAPQDGANKENVPAQAKKSTSLHTKSPTTIRSTKRTSESISGPSLFESLSKSRNKRSSS